MDGKVEAGTEFYAWARAGWRNPLKWGRKEAFYEVVEYNGQVYTEARVGYPLVLTIYDEDKTSIDY